MEISRAGAGRIAIISMVAALASCAHKPLIEARWHVVYKQSSPSQPRRVSISVHNLGTRPVTIQPEALGEFKLRNEKLPKTMASGEVLELEWDILASTTSSSKCTIPPRVYYTDAEKKKLRSVLLLPLQPSSMPEFLRYCQEGASEGR